MKSIKISSIVFYFAILVYIIAFNFAHNPPSGWYQQFLPNLNGQSISDITFLDSLNGFAVTQSASVNDTAYILKTTIRGDNWEIRHRVADDLSAVQFINADTGFTCGGEIYKTTNSGKNWFILPGSPNQTSIEDMSVLNNNTIWFVDSDGLTGGVFRTTNGGMNWIRQFGGVSDQNPDKIYMYNQRIGFITRNFAATPTLRKTTDGGFNWFPVLNEGFTDIYFIDSLTGWKCWYELDSIKKTTDGGINWIKLLLPPTGGFYNLSAINEFSFINQDTIFGVGARGATSLGFRGLIYKSTNGGQTWGYQLPNPNTINIGRYFHLDFINKLNGWAFSPLTGIHTVTGGDTTFYSTSVNQIVSTIPSDYKLYQNYPNPFNPLTKIKYELKARSFVKLKIFNVEGREVKTIVNEKQISGAYEADFSATEYGSSISSGVYFYSLFADERLIDTKKMIVLK